MKVKYAGNLFSIISFAGYKGNVIMAVYGKFKCGLAPSRSKNLDEIVSVVSAYHH